MSKLGVRLEPGSALFPSPRHLIRGLVGLDCEKDFRDRVSGMNRICFYDQMGSMNTKTVSAGEICPLGF